MSLLLNGKVSRGTFDLMEKRLSHITSVVAGLKNILDEEENFWKSKFPEETRILESLLMDFEVRHLLGEIGEEEWAQKSKIIHLGLNSLRNGEALTSKSEPEPARPTQTTLEEQVSEKIATLAEPRGERKPPEEPVRRRKDVKEEGTFVNKHSHNRREDWRAKEPPELGSYLMSTGHCMNPWNTRCKNTDIGLSIYYNGRMVPICRRCWEDISKKNIEWTGLTT